MEKSLITVTVNAESYEGLKHATDTILYQLEQTRKKMNNGASFRISSTNAHDTSKMMALMGQLKWWSLDREAPLKPRKGFWGRLGDELSGILTEDD